MKTLVIHPDDRSTDFLKRIYLHKDWSIITERAPWLSRKFFLKKLRECDRVIMMGHGHPGGLFYSYIDESIAHILRKKDCICIWCNADQFVKKHKLKGFYTGMFISEVGEARFFNINANQDEVDFSNELFTELVAYNIDNEDIHKVLKENYVGESKIIKFNNDRLYYSSDESMLNIIEHKDEFIQYDI